MSGSTIIWILIIGGIVAWQFRPKKPRPKIPFVREAPPAPTKSIREMTADEIEVEKARLAYEQADRARHDARVEHHLTNEDARQKVERARQFVRDSGLDKAIPSIWQDVQHWGSWVTIPDRWTPPAGVTDVGGNRDGDESMSAWRWDDRHYCMRFTKKPNYTPDGDLSFADIKLVVDGNHVVTLGCTRSGHESWEEWRGSSVEMLSVGPWMADVVRFAGHIRLERDKRSWATFAKTDQERAARIDLGDQA